MSDNTATIQSPESGGFRGLSPVTTLGAVDFRWVIQHRYKDNQTFFATEEKSGGAWGVDGQVWGDALTWNGTAEELLVFLLIENDWVEVEEDYPGDTRDYPNERNL